MNNFLVEYAKLAATVEAARERMREIEEKLQAEVIATGAQISAHGYTARMKPGRKSTDHQAAAMYASVPQEIIEQFTTIPEPKIAWAKVTKTARVSNDILAQYTTQSPPSFVIENAT